MEKKPAWLGLVPFAAALIVWFALGGFDPAQRAVGTIFALTVALWITEVLPLAITALLSSALLVLLAGQKEREVLAAYGDPTIPLFIGSFILAKGMELTGLGRRFALILLARPRFSRSPQRLLFSLGLIACVISLFISNTATTAMLLPVGLSMLSSIKGDQRGTPFAMAVMLMLTWGSSIAVGIPVGTPPNLIAIDLIEKETSQRIGFFQWMTFGMPITAAMLVVAWIVLWRLYRRDAPATANATAEARIELDELGGITVAQRNVLIAFGLAVALWMIPDLMGLILGTTHPLAKQVVEAVPPSVAALVAAVLLFVLPNPNAESRMTWQKAATIDWGIILLFGGGIALGTAMFKTGLAKELGTLAATASGAHTVWAITALCTAAAILLSELASNTAAATTLVPVAIGLSQGAGVSPLAPALGVALGASLGFMLPVSTAPNAIVYSSGLVPPKQMIKAGFMIDVAGFLITMLGLYLFLPLTGLK
jgi:solute carrier family 13 (sodium-dependent dicarboxylate transporter), member 2/3/5